MASPRSMKHARRRAATAKAKGRRARILAMREIPCARMVGKPCDCPRCWNRQGRIIAAEGFEWTGHAA